MKPELILRSDLLDILFEHRNKAYGAYNLRRLYNSHLLAGIGGMVVLSVGMWIFSPKYKGQLKSGSPFTFTVSDTIRLSNAPNTVIPPPPAQAPNVPRARFATVDNASFVIDPNAANSEVPDQTQLDEVRIGTVTQTGAEYQGEPTGSDNNLSGPAPAAPIPPPIEEAPEVLTTAAVMPQFPGGEAALQRWLSRQLKPREEQEPGQRIKVVVRFVVGRSGEIDRIELVQPGGAAFDREVLRVIHKMPRWEAGHHNGKTVAVWFSIPIIFEMPEQ